MITDEGEEVLSNQFLLPHLKNMYCVTWKDIQRKRTLKKVKEIGQIILAIIIMLVAMAIGGMTYPY